MELDVGEAEAKAIAAKTRDELAEIRKADEITAKVLFGKAVTTEEYRYIVLFNLRALTQIMWEISNKLEPYAKELKNPSKISSLSGNSAESTKP